MRKMKYIRSERYGILCFSDITLHDMMAQILSLKKEDIISAGFIDVNDSGKLYCYGESISLNRKCIDSDTYILQRQIGQVDIY